MATMSALHLRSPRTSFIMSQRWQSSARPAAAQLRETLTGKRVSLVANLVPQRPLPKAVQPEGARLRWGRGPLGSVARAAEKEREVAEREVEMSLQRSAARSPIGLYPIYDCPRQVAGTFTGTKVLSPASLRHALAEAHRSVPRAGMDGKVLRGALQDEEEIEYIDEGPEDEEETAKE
eukprot:TRINITY_DN13978_c0_g1_i1.p1 TRINITY_DN13978_c0_g1~~TRINITY_DN13978_c0_g1_i1.p1  ORF type:complete len:186 (+),score=36.32 TRINITY_DN13978_c0_g1_i1:27-560(+)